MVIGTWALKLRLIFLPFLFIGVGFIGLYTFLNWLLFIKLDLFPVREIIRNFGLPFILPLIPLLIWLKPRIKLLEFKNEKEKKDYHSYYFFAAAAVISIATVIAQEYLTTASGKLTELASIHTITTLEKTKFYTVKNYYVSKKNYGAYVTGEVSGSRQNKLRLYLYITLPIYDSIKGANKKIPHAWLGLKYSEEVDNYLSDVEKERKYDAFLEKSQTDFASRNVQEFVYLDRISHSDDLNGYKEALKKSSKFKLDNDIVLIPINTPFEARNGHKFEWIFLSFMMGAFAWLLMILYPRMDENAVSDLLKRKPISEVNEFKEFLVFTLIPKKDFFVTPILINLNIFIFLSMFLLGHGWMSMKGTDLLNWGANYGPAIANGEYWRLISSNFLHGGIIHLIGNIFGLLFVGIVLEPILGKAKFALAYVGTGIMASLSSIYWYDATISVGASGAVFGLCGVLLALLVTKIFPFDIDHEFNSYFFGMIAIFVGSSLVMGFLGGVDNAAHIGGLASGFILGLMQSLRFHLSGHCIFLVNNIDRTEKIE